MASFLAFKLQIILFSRPVRFSKVLRIFLKTTKLVPVVKSRFRLFFMKTEITNRVPKHLTLFDRKSETVISVPKQAAIPPATASSYLRVKRRYRRSRELSMELEKMQVRRRVRVLQKPFLSPLTKTSTDR